MEAMGLEPTNLLTARWSQAIDPSSIGGRRQGKIDRRGLPLIARDRHRGLQSWLHGLAADRSGGVFAGGLRPPGTPHGPGAVL